MRALYALLLTLQYADRDGVLHRMGSRDILVVASYNMQFTVPALGQGRHDAPSTSYLEPLRG